MHAVKLTMGDDGIVVATMDLPGRATNLVGEALLAGLGEALEHLAHGTAKGLVLTSAKADFCTGGDIDRMSKWASAEEAFNATMAMKRVLRRLETQGKPVVAAINGHALGGGLELALACHARLAIDDTRLKLGQPEIKFGLLPGGGGTVRLSRLLGLQPALQICVEGAEMDVHRALGLGLLTGLAKDHDDLLARARAWCLAHPKAQQPWDAPKFRFPGGDSRVPAVAQLFSVAPSVAAVKSRGNYPAVTHTMSALFEGGLLDFDAASVVESRYLAACAMSPQSRNLIGTLWHQLNALKKGASRSAGVPKSTVTKLGVLGAGMMGAGIAHAAAVAGVTVVLIDTSPEVAERGRAQAQALLDKAVQRGRSTAAQRDVVLARITPTADVAALVGCELVIEAVFEDRQVKAEVTQQAEAVLSADAVLASNTSTLPITGLARASARPAQFIGLHFFSPVDRMALVEIVVGAQTSDVTLARGFDFVRQIGKTPIVVNDSRGFYTSRVFGTYLMEGLAMLAEGVHPRSIEVAGLQAGMPMPPLALQDEVSLSLSLHVAEQARSDAAAEGRAVAEHPGMDVVRHLCSLGRTGRKVGRGFYEGTDEDRQLWPGLAQHYPVAATQPEQRELIDRLLFVQANEAARCYEEKVVRSVADANIGSIFGWGFAPFHGGALQFINATGAAAFVLRARELAAKFGPRFAPADVVMQLGERGGHFVDP
ncbi:MAG: 3-hydroxyacyl-CoA dehydrogenase NAD-binding domain-containing protein [Rubrivivax sp.]|nr:3-hydroxyacyl-CoA dehydrogenase NAD-binding domain-containing protein [Rubrivivax sp.]